MWRRYGGGLWEDVDDVGSHELKQKLENSIVFISFSRFGIYGSRNEYELILHPSLVGQCAVNAIDELYGIL